MLPPLLTLPWPSFAPAFPSLKTTLPFHPMVSPPHWEASGPKWWAARGTPKQRGWERRHCWLTRLYQTDTDWLDLEFSFRDLLDTNSSRLSQETASHWQREKTAVRTLANALPQGRLGDLGMVMPPITEGHATISRMLPMDLYTWGHQTPTALWGREYNHFHFTEEKLKALNNMVHLRSYYS